MDYNPEGTEKRREQDKTENKEGDNSNKDKAEKEQRSCCRSCTVGT